MDLTNKALTDAFERCPSYGSGSVDYTKEDVAILEEMRVNMQALLNQLDEDGSYFLGKYLEASEKHLRRCNRYYFYWGILHGFKDVKEVLEIEHEGE